MPAKGFFFSGKTATDKTSRPSTKGTREMVVLFPFSEYWWFYAAFIGLILLLLSLDLGVFHRKAHAISFRESAIWSGVWIALALAFNVALYQYALWKFPQDPRLM